MALSDSRLQYLLAQSEAFRARLQMIMTQVATEVLTEQDVGATHAARAAYAQRVLQTSGPVASGGVAGSAALFFAQSTNVRGTITEEDNGVVSSVTDAALASQVASSWDLLSGVDLGS